MGRALPDGVRPGAGSGLRLTTIIQLFLSSTISVDPCANSFRVIIPSYL